jgi:DNA damage-inducible protein 1
MRLTFVNDLGESTEVEIDAQMELENVMALLEAETGIPIAEQSIHFEGKDLNDPKKTIQDYEVPNASLLLLRRKVSAAGRTIEQDAEMMRLQILGNPHLLRQLQSTQPELAAAAQQDPARFAQLLQQTQQRQQQAEQERAQAEAALMSADPYDVDAQRRIEEAIRQQAVLENLEHALEYSPESFGRVTMLYIPLEVNGHPIKAFVDSGAQQTIISPECAEACGIMRLLDTRFQGVARGVGTAKILGRVHSAQLKIADLFLNCSFTVMEGRDVDLLFGLDMLKAYQACIDLEKNCLRIRGREITFLSEHELPDKARFEMGAAPEDPQAPPSVSQPTRSGAGANFPGSGNTLGTAPAAAAQGSVGQNRADISGTQRSAPQAPAAFPEDHIRTIMDLGGVSREVAISTLAAAGGNLDVAAALLFQ